MTKRVQEITSDSSFWSNAKDYERIDICFSDIHIRKHSFVPQYLKQCGAILSYIYDALVKHDNVNLLFLGDLFDSAKPTNSEQKIAAIFFDLLRRVKDKKDYVFISGNHVKSDYRETDPVRFLLDLIHLFMDVKEGDYFNNITYVQDPETIISHDGLVSYFSIPYDPIYMRGEEGSELFIETLKRLVENSNTKHRVLLSHLPTANGFYDTGFASTSGLLMTTEHVRGADLVLMGDYHTPQRLRWANAGLDADTITRDGYCNDEPFGCYIGAPFQFYFSHKFKPCIRLVGYKKSGDIDVIKLNTEDILSIEQQQDYGSIYNENFFLDVLCPYTYFVTYDLGKDGAVEKIFEDLQNLPENFYPVIRIHGVHGIESNHTLSLIRTLIDKINDQRGDYPILLMDGRTTLSEMETFSNGEVSDSFDEFLENSKALSGTKMVGDFTNFLFNKFYQEGEDEHNKGMRSILAEITSEGEGETNIKVKK